jgi:hypothetical protein
LGQKIGFSCNGLLDDINLGSNVLLKFHGVGDTVLRGHLVRFVLDVVQLAVGFLHPAVDGLDGLVKVVERAAEVFNLLNLLLEAANNLQFLLDGLDFLLDKVFLVLRQSHGHDIVVVLDVGEHGLNGGLAVVEDLLSLFQVLESSCEVETFLDLLHLLLSALELDNDGFKTLSITFPGSLGVLEECETGLSLVLGLIPTFFNALDMSVQEFGFAEIIQVYY